MVVLLEAGSCRPSGAGWAQPVGTLVGALIPSPVSTSHTQWPTQGPGFASYPPGVGDGGHLTAEYTGGFLWSMVLSAFPSPCHKHVLGIQPQEPALKPEPTWTMLATQSVSNSVRLPGGPEAKLSASGNVAPHLISPGPENLKLTARHRQLTAAHTVTLPKDSPWAGGADKAPAC